MQLAHKLLSTRGGTIALACIAAVLSAGALLAYLSKYRESVNAQSQPVTALVAKSLIEKGTPGSVVGRQQLFQASDFAEEDVNAGAITDPKALDGLIAAQDIYPGQQLTAESFTATGAGAIGTKLAEDQRAISVPVDSAHGVLGHIRSGDRVDVYAGFNVTEIDQSGAPVENGTARPILRLIMEDIAVLSAPTAEDGSASGGGTTNNVTLRVTDAEATKVAFAADNGKVWLVLRPRTGGTPSTPDVVTLETLLLGVKPINALRSFGGRR
ncbi:MAG: Flp pilus assembly protein CpaB [Actinomycetota bacterium]|nr:Flp pilus assembly protein CpaB [Actinomycetota bacterium]